MGKSTLSLYFISDFAFYHQFLVSPEMGIHKSKADLKALRKLPIPIENIYRQGLDKWSELHRQLSLASGSPSADDESQQGSLYSGGSQSGDTRQLEAEVNSLAYSALKLRSAEIALVSDLANQRRLLIQGKVDKSVVRPPSADEMRAYCETIKRHLDAFFEVATAARHSVEVVYEDESAMIVVERGSALAVDQAVKITSAGDVAGMALRKVRDRLIRKQRQWLYFQRDLRKYQNATTYLFKPMHRIHWLQSQALIDAREVLADRTGGQLDVS